MKEKFREEKKIQSVFLMKILLSSCSLVGFYVSVQVNFTEKKNDENFQSVFQVNVLKIKGAIC